MHPHRIRLRGPWECEPLASGEDVPQRRRFRRRFGYPGRIDDYERVWLTFAGVVGSASVWLNGQLLGRDEHSADFEYEVTALLKPRNEVVVEAQAPAESGVPGEVAMEVRRTAFLRAVRIRVEREGDIARLHVSGQIVGTAERPLEVYVVLDRSTVAYAVADATPEGRAFALTSDDLAPARWQGAGHAVRVDLVDAASVWYTVEQAVDF
jgi:hypothetical protein